MEESIKEETVRTRIYRLRGQRVMLSHELADLYQVEPRALIQAVKRNIERFPLDFMFQLSDSERNIYMNLRSQIVILRWGQHRKYPPYAFTEQGIAMLSSVLRSPRAIQVNIAIMRAFVKLRHALFQNKDLAQKFEKLEGRVNIHDTDIRLLVQDVHELKKKSTPDLEKIKEVKGFSS